MKKDTRKKNKRVGQAIRFFVLLSLMAQARTGLTAIWEPFGTGQIASWRVIAPQVNLLASKAKCPLLPMIVSAGLNDNPATQLMGRPDADWERLIRGFVNEAGDFSFVHVWAVPEGREALLKAHPEWKVVNGLVSAKLVDEPIFISFSPDGKTAFITTEAELAVRCAKENPPRPKPLAKGLVALEMDAEGFRRFAKALPEFLSAFLTGNADEQDESFSFIPADFPKAGLQEVFEALAREISGLRIVFGVSSSGLDVRLRFTFAPGSPLAAGWRRLPADAVQFRKIPANANIVFASVPFARGSGVETAWRRFVPRFLQAMRGHFDRALAASAEELKESKEAKAFGGMMRSLSFMADALGALAVSPAAYGQIAYSFAQDETDRLRCLFRATGVTDAVAFTRKPPMDTTFENAAGVYSVIVQQPGFKPGAESIARAFAQTLPEYVKLKTPLFAGRLQTGIAIDPSTKKEISVGVWSVGWLDRSEKTGSASFRALLRLSMEDLGRALAVGNIME